MSNSSFSYEGTGSGAGYQLTLRDKEYRDISLAFEPNPLNGDITILRNERAINNAMKNIVLTIVGEKPFNHDFGSRVNAFLFDVVDDASAGLLQDEIERAILLSEPRVTFAEPTSSEITGYSGYYKSNTVRQETKESAQLSLVYGQKLGVFVQVQPDQNAMEVTIRYRIVGDEKVYEVQQILYPTR